MSFLTSSGVFLKKDTKSFVRYSTPEKYCEYGVHQVGLCLSHPPRGCTTPGGGGDGEAPPRGPTPYPFIYHFWKT